MSEDNRISLQKLEVFVKVATLGGVRKAAEALYISQPVVSAHIRSLQDRIGTQLFERDGRGIALTEGGERVLVWANDVLQGRSELGKELASLVNGDTGTVSIGCTMTVGNVSLAPVVIAFKKDNPDAVIRLEMTPAENALEGVRTGRHDFAVVAGYGVLDSRIFQVEMLSRPPLALIAPPNSTLPEEIRPDTLAGLPFVAPPEGMAIRRSQDIALIEIGVQDRRVEIELGTAEAITEAVREGLGVALLSRVAIADQIAQGLLREIRIKAPTMRDTILLVQRANKRSTTVQKRLRQAIQRSFKELAALDSPEAS